MLSEEEIRKVMFGKPTKMHTIQYQVQMEVGDKILNFQYPNVVTCEYGEKLIILNNYPTIEIENHPCCYDVIAVDVNGNVLWHMEDPKEANATKGYFQPNGDVLPVEVYVQNNYIVVHDLCVGNFILDANTGKIIGFFTHR